MATLEDLPVEAERDRFVPLEVDVERGDRVATRAVGVPFEDVLGERGPDEADRVGVVDDDDVEAAVFDVRLLAPARGEPAPVADEGRERAPRPDCRVGLVVVQCDRHADRVELRDGPQRVEDVRDGPEPVFLFGVRLGARFGREATDTGVAERAVVVDAEVDPSALAAVEHLERLFDAGDADVPREVVPGPTGDDPGGDAVERRRPPIRSRGPRSRLHAPGSGPSRRGRRPRSPG